MANSIGVKLDTSKYKSPTQADINAAKKFILQREEYARLLENRVDSTAEDEKHERSHDKAPDMEKHHGNHIDDGKGNRENGGQREEVVAVRIPRRIAQLYDGTDPGNAPDDGGNPLDNASRHDQVGGE